MTLEDARKELEGDTGVCPDCGINHFAEWAEDEDDDDFPILSVTVVDTVDGKSP